MWPAVLPRNKKEMLNPMELLDREYDRMFRNLWDEEGRNIGEYPINLREEEESVYVEAEMPGFKPEDLDVQVDHGVLNIKAERKAEESKGREHMKERRFTKVERSISLPAEIDESKIDAKLEDGVLYLTMPKGEKSKPKNIPIHS